MAPEPSLRRLRADLSPQDGARERVLRMVRQKLPETAPFADLNASLAPRAGARDRVWARILTRTEGSPAVTALDALRAYLSPAGRIDRAPAFAFAGIRQRGGAGMRFAKWTAAFAVFALIIQGLPPLFLAPKTVAESQATVLPTKGEISIDLEGFWQPVSKEFALKTAAAFRTNDGQATILLNDDGNIRLSEDTAITLHDVADRPAPTTAESTLTLESGKAWIQAFVPFHVRPIIVRTPHAFVRILEGSASVQVAEGSTFVRVWDRHATVSFRDRDLILVAGEWTEISSDNVAVVKRISDDSYDDTWVAQNLKRDAVHRREIAQRQHERSIADAGILPTSALYPVKRVAEKVDELMSFSEEERIQKKLDQATTRLNEAAALIAEGNSGASVPLEEFRVTLREIASGTGGDVVAQDLIRQQVEASTSQLAASTPDDESYPLKVAVLEASAELQQDESGKQEVEAVLLADAVSSAADVAESGDTERAAELLEELSPRLTSVRAGELPAEMRKDMESAVAQLTAALDEAPAEGTAEETAQEPAKEVTPPPRVPQTPKPQPPVRRLSSGELDKLVAGILTRVNNLELPRSRWNQLQLEIADATHDYPADIGTILRQLHIVFRSDETLDGLIKAHIQELRNGAL